MYSNTTGKCKIDFASTWSHARGAITLDHPVMMGILNVTPDSFSDGGMHYSENLAVQWAFKLASEGAEIIDIGGESTRPGALPVDVSEELFRVVPVVRRLRAEGFSAVISIDTRRAEVAEAALKVGADIINDITSMADPDMAEVVRMYGAGIVLMHGGIQPSNLNPDHRFAILESEYSGPDEVASRLSLLAVHAEEQGICKKNICIDPGFGFGKKGQTNFDLLDGLDSICALGYPVLVGASRKHFFRNSEMSERQFLREAYKKGTRIFRVHEVSEHFFN